MFNHIDKVTIVNKLRSFQFRFLHRILFFNDRLFKCKLADSTLCDFCNEAIDSIEHRYFYCRITQEFWSNLSIWIKQRFNVECIFSRAHFIVTNIYRQMPLMETILLNAKYYIFTCFVRKTIPTISSFKNIVNVLETTERHIALQRNLLYAHERKWNIHWEIEWKQYTRTCTTMNVLFVWMYCMNVL